MPVSGHPTAASRVHPECKLRVQGSSSSTSKSLLTHSEAFCVCLQARGAAAQLQQLVLEEVPQAMLHTNSLARSHSAECVFAV